jgi:hypothetical protein
MELQIRPQKPHPLRTSSPGLAVDRLLASPTTVGNRYDDRRVGRGPQPSERSHGGVDGVAHERCGDADEQPDQDTYRQVEGGTRRNRRGRGHSRLDDLYGDVRRTGDDWGGRCRGGTWGCRWSALQRVNEGDELPGHRVGHISGTDRVGVSHRRCQNDGVRDQRNRDSINELTGCDVKAEALNHRPGDAIVRKQERVRLDAVLRQ